MSKKQTHVVPNPDGGWDIKQSGQSGGKRSSGHFDTKKDAVDRAREISGNQGNELVIHNKDGKISQKDNHGNDPHPPKGEAAFNKSLKSITGLRALHETALALRRSALRWAELELTQAEK